MDWILLFKITWAFFQVGILAFGGGYAALPLIEKQVVDINGWMTLTEFADVLAIDELTPGPIAINCATFVGTKLSGIPGAIMATFGCVLPSIVICLTLVHLYQKYRKLSIVNSALAGLKAMVVAAIGSVALSFLINAIFGSNGINIEKIDFLSLVIMIVSLFILRKYKADPLYVLLGSGLVSLIVLSIF